MESADELVAARERAAARPTEAEDAGATMIYTSGTTGKPKGALRRNAADPQQIGAMLQFIGYTPDDVYLTTGPLYHSGPGRVHGRGDGARPDGRAAAQVRPGGLAAPGGHLPLHVDVLRADADPHDLQPAGRRQGRYDRSSMRIMIANAAPWSFALKQQYVADFPPESLFEVYGSTELGVNTILRPEDQLRKPGSCGKEAPMVEIRLYDDDGNVVEGTGPEATGELFVRSPSVFADYYKQHDKFEEDSRDGFQTVGDIAYRDDEGFLYICDRKKDMIISGGMNIYPAEIEAALERPPRRLRGRGVRHPQRGVGRVGPRRRRRPPGSTLDDEERRRRTPASTSPATRCRGRSRGSTSCPRPARARCSSASCGRPTGPAAPPTSPQSGVRT